MLLGLDLVAENLQCGIHRLGDRAGVLFGIAGPFATRVGKAGSGGGKSVGRWLSACALTT